MKPEPPRVPEAPPGLFPFPPGLTPTLEGGPYVFPVFGSSSYGDTYGGSAATSPTTTVSTSSASSASRSSRSRTGRSSRSAGRSSAATGSGCATAQGNAYYYAHLSAFSTLIANGVHVRAGQVIGFMGNTGDADGKPTHLHFEMHPVSLLYLGYDGAVDPTPYVDGWRRLRTAAVPGAAGLGAEPDRAERRAAAGRHLARGLGHLVRGRPRSRLAAAGDRGAAGAALRAGRLRR